MSIYVLSKRSCSICNKPHCSKGYCNAHYGRWRRHGDPLSGGTSKGDPLRFIHEVAIYHTGDECLTWPFGKSSNGYGKLTATDGKEVLASRYVCELVNGPPPTPEHEAAHSCGQGHEGCISPGHLGWKTHIENMADKLIHGTHNRGERCGAAKLTEPEAREILALKGIKTQRELAERFKVARQTIAKIQAGHNWAWLSEATEGVAA